MSKPENQVSKDIRILIAEQERQSWLQTREQLLMRYRVNKRLNLEELMKANLEELTKCETAIDEYDKIISELKEEK